MPPGSAADLRVALAAPAAPVERWQGKAGSWLGIGASPAGLVLGAGLASRHHGATPLVALVLGLLLVVLLLAAQGMLGLCPPHGDGGTLGEVSRHYLTAADRNVVTSLLALAMVGWLGFNEGLGGAALAALLGLPDAAGAVLLGVPLTAVCLLGLRRWNAVAVLATVAALALVCLVVTRLHVATAPVTPRLGDVGSVWADVAAYLGAVAVFAVRSPDFTAGLGRRVDLAWCVGLLAVPLGVMTVVGAAMYLGSGSTDVVAMLGGPLGARAANALLAVAVVAPTLATAFSGALAAAAVSGLSVRRATLLVAVPGLVLAALRFDRHLVPWLTLLAAVLPPLIVPMSVEAWRRRRGLVGRLVPRWSWVPGSVVALALTVAGWPGAPLTGLVLAGVGTAVWLAGERRLGAAERS